MEVGRSGEGLLRNRSLLILPFLAPCVPQSWLKTRQKIWKVTQYKSYPTCAVKCFTTCSRRKQQPVTAAEQTRSRDPPPGDRGAPLARPANDPSRRSAPESTKQKLGPEYITDWLGDLSNPSLSNRRTAMANGDRPSYNQTPRTRRQDNTPQPDLLDPVASTVGGQNAVRSDKQAVDDKLNEIQRYQNSAEEVEAAYRQYKADKSSGSSTGGGILENMRFPQTNLTPAQQRQTQQNLLQHQISKDVDKTTPRARRTIQSRPSVGRTIELDPHKGIDFGRSLNMLGARLAQNKVRGMKSKQQFHERPGMKRKRLRSERWRRFFKAGFQATVQRVKQMKMQGW